MSTIPQVYVLPGLGFRSIVPQAYVPPGLVGSLVYVPPGLASRYTCVNLGEHRPGGISIWRNIGQEEYTNAVGTIFRKIFVGIRAPPHILILSNNASMAEWLI